MATGLPRKDRSPRKRVLLAGCLCHSGGLYHFLCSIKDISEKGARIAVPTEQIYPDRIYLVVINQKMAHEAQVVWRRGQQAGLKFIRSFLVTEPPEPSLNYLKRVWVEYALR